MKKNIVMVIAVIMAGLCIAGGTYAWLFYSINTTNNSYAGKTDCFLIDYNINNSDNTQDITGTMFPGSGPAKGLSGRVGLKLNDSCSVVGLGTLKLHINSGTSTKFGTVGAAHCENTQTGETLHEYTTSDACSGHGTWTSSTTPLKYAIYDNDSATGTPLAKGYITTSDIGSDKVIYNNIVLNRVQKYFYIFLWLDGYMTDNTYTNLPFSGYISANATQDTDSPTLPSGYQKVEYIASNGTQYIDTGFVANQDTRFVMKIKYLSGNFIFGSDEDTSGKVNCVGLNSSSGKFRWHFDNQDYKDVGTVTYGNIYEVDVDKNIMYLNGKRMATFNNATFSTPSSVLISGIRRGTSINMSTYGSSLEIYSFKIYDNGVLVRNFIPCYKTSGTVIGLYDIMHDVFYQNAGTGSFTKGSNV